MCLGYCTVIVVDLHTCILSHTHIYIYIYMCMYVCMYAACMYVFVFVFARNYVCMYACARVSMQCSATMQAHVHK